MTDKSRQHLRSVQIGCGARAQTHARVLSNNDRFDLVAVCDLDEERATETADRFEVENAYTDFREMLAAESPEHVTVVTPATVRLSVLSEVLEASPESLVFEKPVANSVEEANELADLVESADTHVVVSHQLIYADEIQTLKEWVDEGRLGEPERITVTTKLGLTDKGTHHVHLLNWLFDETPLSVRGYAEGRHTLDPATSHGPAAGQAEPGDALVELTYPGNCRAFFHHGFDAPEVPPHEASVAFQDRVDLVGTNGHVEFVFDEYVRGTFRDGTTETVEGRPFEEDSYMTDALYEDVARLGTGELERHPADFASALSVQRTLDAAMRSALESRAIAPDERPLPLGESAAERLRTTLASKRPVVVSSRLFGNLSRPDLPTTLDELGCSHLDLWSTPEASHFDPHEDLETVEADLGNRVSVPVVSVGTDGNIEKKLALAGDLGASTVVLAGLAEPSDADQKPLREWLDAAADHDVTLAFGGGSVAEMEALLDDLDHEAAGVRLSPPRLVRAGDSAEEAFTRLGDSIAVVALRDANPATVDRVDGDWRGNVDDQVPGGGGAVDFGQVLSLADRFAPDAELVLDFEGSDIWSTDRTAGAVARAVRYLHRMRR